eukprot:s3286_g9.t1
MLPAAIEQRAFCWQRALSEAAKGLLGSNHWLQLGCLMPMAGWKLQASSTCHQDTLCKPIQISIMKERFGEFFFIFVCVRNLCTDCALRGVLDELRAKEVQPVEQVVPACLPLGTCGKLTDGDREKFKGLKAATPSVAAAEQSADARLPRTSAHEFLQHVRIPDGGGRVKKFESLCNDWGLLPCLRKHVADPSSSSLLTDSELESVRSELVDFLISHGYPCSTQIAPNQPFLLEAWAAMAQFTGDPDFTLPELLQAGVATGILEPIQPSGIWDPVLEEATSDPELSVHLEPWGSAKKSPELTWELIQKNLDTGHLVEIPGGEFEARARWGKNIAAGKLGVVVAEGRKPRLIGDGTVSGTKAASQILAKVRLPNLEAVQRSLSSHPDGDWTAWSFDIRGAHRLVKVKEEEQGFSCFVFEDRWFFYRCCYFGARRSAFWFSAADAFATSDTAGQGKSNRSDVHCSDIFSLDPMAKAVAEMGGYGGTLVASLKIPGDAQLVPSEPPSKALAPEVADCVVNPLQAQYAWDSLSSLIESCRRLRQKNLEAMAEFPKRGPFWEEMPKPGETNVGTVTGA